MSPNAAARLLRRRSTNSVALGLRSRAHSSPAWKMSSSAGDLMMTTVLRIMPELIQDARLKAYVERCTARPAFQRAFDAQMGDFSEAA